MNLERDLPVALALVIALGAVAAAVLLTTWWWRGDPKNGGESGGSKKALARTPGVQVLRIQDSTEGPNGGGWSRSSSSSCAGEAGGRAKGRSKWEQSKQKGDLGYYFAHHITMKELAPEDYRMNGPRLLSKGDTSRTPDGAPPSNGSSSASAPASSSSSSPSPPPMPSQRRRRPQQISSYSWEDYGEEVRLTFRQPDWDSWAKVAAEEIFVEWDPRRFRMSIDSREYGPHAIDLPRLSGEVADVRVKKLKTRLVVALVKAGHRRGGYGKNAAWTNLQAPPEKPAD
ncbi:unnamed protein product [Scytosiphon promiscuus]